MSDKPKIWDQDCTEWADRQKIYLGHYTMPIGWFRPRFHVLRRRTNWLKLVRCRCCSTDWYVGIDTIDDDYYFQRVSKEERVRITQNKVWPDTFDEFPQFGLVPLTPMMWLPKPPGFAVSTPQGN